MHFAWSVGMNPLVSEGAPVIGFELLSKIHSLYLSLFPKYSKEWMLCEFWYVWDAIDSEGLT